LRACAGSEERSGGKTSAAKSHHTAFDIADANKLRFSSSEPGNVPDDKEAERMDRRHPQRCPNTVLAGAVSLFISLFRELLSESN
jgi:hypothetical protein